LYSRAGAIAVAHSSKYGNQVTQPIPHLLDSACLYEATLLRNTDYGRSIY
jgi:hypothetical protein